MADEQKYIFERNSIVVYALLFSIVFIIYGNTFNSPWHLDDYQNITHSSRVQIEHLDFHSLKKSFLASQKDSRMDRPLSYLTFAVNWYFGGNNPFGYHIVNICIHVLSAIFLFLTIFHLLHSPNLRDKYSDDQINFISLLAAVLWAVNPIQTQAVTYIVQRMASMAAMFYIVGIYLYIKGRLSQGNYKRIYFFSGCFLSFLLGFASKENAVTLPLSILMVEAIFFQNLADIKKRKIFIGISGGGIVSILVVGTLLFLQGNPINVLNYSSRHFSAFERLLTEPRIILFYISQIFYPAPTRLSIEHDVVISTSFFHPWSTLPSIIIVLVLIGFSLYKIRKWPILSFAILFFFLNHVIESSVIGLELIFEHRNYLPSMFLFFPVAVGIYRLLDYYRGRKPWMRLVLIGFISLMIVGFGFSTYVRNMAWTSGKYLWEDAMAKAPNAGRPLHNLAWDYYQRIGDHNKALSLYFNALNLSNTNISQKSLILNNIAGIYYGKGYYKKAAEYWEKAVTSYPDYTETWYRLALSQTRLGDLTAAMANLSKVISKNPEHLEANNLKGIILFKQNKIEDALSYFKKCIKLRPTRKASLLNVGAALNQIGLHGKAKWFFKNAYFRYPNDPIVLLWLINTHHQSSDETEIDYYVGKLIDLVGVNQLPGTIKRLSKDFLYADSIIAPELDDSLPQALNQQLNRKLQELKQLDLSTN